MSDDELKGLFEAYNRAALQVAVNATEGDERITRIWVYTLIDGHSVETTWHFQVGSRSLGPEELADELGLGEHTDSSLADEVWDELMPFMRGLIAKGDLPQRIVTEYDPQAGSAWSDWDYEGVLQGDDDTPGRARDRWIVEHGGQPVFG